MNSGELERTALEGLQFTGILNDSPRADIRMQSVPWL